MSDNYYCPKCGKKKLQKERSWDRNHRAYFTTWRCYHNAGGRTWRAKKPDGPRCDVEIKVDGRDAEIDDWDNLLGKMSMISVPQIQQWLLKNESDCHKRGMEVIYEGEIASLVRRRDGDGVGVGLYWNRDTWDTDPDVINPMSTSYDALRWESAQYLSFEGFNLRYLFTHRGVNLWAAGEDQDDAVFKGKSVGKRLKAKLCAFAQRLEKAIPSLLEKAQVESARWVSEKGHFERCLKSAFDGVEHFGITHYCGERQTAQINLRYLSVEGMLEANTLLNLDMKVGVQIGQHSDSVKPEVAIRFQEVLGIDVGRQNISEHFQGAWRTPGRRINLDEGIRLAKIVKADRDQ